MKYSHLRWAVLAIGLFLPAPGAQATTSAGLVDQPKGAFVLTLSTGSTSSTVVSVSVDYVAPDGSDVSVDFTIELPGNTSPEAAAEIVEDMCEAYGVDTGDVNSSHGTVWILPGVKSAGADVAGGLKGKGIASNKATSIAKKEIEKRVKDTINPFVSRAGRVAISIAGRDGSDRLATELVRVDIPAGLTSAQVDALVVSALQLEGWNVRLTPAGRYELTSGLKVADIVAVGANNEVDPGCFFVIHLNN